jgi:hypothetical protein
MKPHSNGRETAIVARIGVGRHNCLPFCTTMACAQDRPHGETTKGGYDGCIHAGIHPGSTRS